jgi:hypothetical protein
VAILAGVRTMDAVGSSREATAPVSTEKDTNAGKYAPLYRWLYAQEEGPLAMHEGPEPSKTDTRSPREGSRRRVGETGVRF